VKSSRQQNNSIMSGNNTAETDANMAVEDPSTDAANNIHPIGYSERVVAKAQTGDKGASILEARGENLDWVLTNYDQKNSEPQSLEEELKRLQALRSYLLLDSEREEQFERLTALASRIMNVPIALVSLVDLGRQWFMSNRGLGDVRETPRSSAFCSHAILSKNEVLIIKDAQKDPRFVKNPLVTGPPYIRFYAGAPLETPEGYKLGTFCIIDTKPWPEGLDLDGKQNLREFAGLAVEVMISRRKRRERNQEKNSQLIACAAHDLLTPLSGIELSLHLLSEDADFQEKLAQKHKGKMSKVQTCSDVIQEICDSVRNTYAETKSSFEQSLMTSKLERVNIQELVEKLYTAIEAVKSDVPVEITVEKNVPKEVISDSSKLFRGALNYLVIACNRTKKGRVALSFSVKKESEASKKSLLVVTCEDTAPAIDIDVYEHLFKPPSKGIKLFEESSYENGENTEQNLDLCLFSVACEMNVVGGEFGFRPRAVEDNGSRDDGKMIASVTGSVFWFCIPCMDYDDECAAESKLEAEEAKQSIVAEGDASQKKVEATVNPETRKKRALVIEDSAIIRKMLNRILVKKGFDVSEADNGMQGLEKLKSSLFDITFVDFLMPVMDGLDCMQQYREWEKMHRPWISQRLIGISAHASQEDVERGLKLGMDDYRAKPITAKVLSNLLESDKQVEMSRHLDEIEKREAVFKGTGDGSNGKESKKRKRKHAINGRACTLLMISPKSEQEQTKLMQETIKESGWQTTTASTEREALVWLKMRTWDLVLVDDAFGPVIGDFRKWESKKRQNQQERITLMAGNANELEGDGVQSIQGFDAIVRKPVGLSAVEKLLKKTYLQLSKSD